MTGCLFCRIVAGEVESDQLYQDDRATAFRDIYPKAPVHVLIVPNKHISSVNDIVDEDEPLIGHLFTIASLLADKEGIAHSGYRLIANTGPDGRQEIPHLHLHLLGGRPMQHSIG